MRQDEELLAPNESRGERSDPDVAANRLAVQRRRAVERKRRLERAQRVLRDELPRAARKATSTSTLSKSVMRSVTGLYCPAAHSSTASDKSRPCKSAPDGNWTRGTARSWRRRGDPSEWPGKVGRWGRLCAGIEGNLGQMAQSLERDEVHPNNLGNARPSRDQLGLSARRDANQPAEHRLRGRPSRVHPGSKRGDAQLRPDFAGDSAGQDVRCTEADSGGEALVVGCLDVDDRLFEQRPRRLDAGCRSLECDQRRDHGTRPAASDIRPFPAGSRLGVDPIGDSSSRPLV